MKSFAESNPFSAYNLPRLRKDFGLKRADTWKTLLGQNIPMVIPMMPSTFARPSDWPDRVKLTDFIFLRPPKKEASAPPPDPLSTLPAQIADYITAAHAAERKLVVMTFSSMPVARRKVLECATKMLTQSAVPFSLIYVGTKQADKIPKELEASATTLATDGKLLEVERADFGVLFPLMDSYIVHGGLGTTVEALRMKKPVAVTGILLMDQRFWGGVVADKGVGPPPVHVDKFSDKCVEFINDVRAHPRPHAAPGAPDARHAGTGPLARLRLHHGRAGSQLGARRGRRRGGERRCVQAAPRRGRHARRRWRAAGGAVGGPRRGRRRVAAPRRSWRPTRRQ